MNNNNFDYISFSITLKSVAWQNIPEDIDNEDKVYIATTIENFVQMAGKAFEEDSNNYTEEQLILYCQIISEWIFHKSIDIIRADVPVQYRDNILQLVAFTIFEVVKQCYDKHFDEKDVIRRTKYHVNKAYKTRIEELFSSNEISRKIYNNAISFSHFDEFQVLNKENHEDCYEIEESKDNKYLKDKSLEMYCKTLAHIYLIKAAHVLKKHNCKKEDRRNLLSYLNDGIQYIISCATCTLDDYNENQMERLITVSMELLFHRIVVLYKNNILHENNSPESLINYYASTIYSIEIQYIKDNDKLIDTYDYTNTFSNSSLKQYLKDWLDQSLITQEQYNKVLDKSYMVYLENEICHIMKTTKIPKTIMTTCIVLAIWLILKVIIYFLRYH